MSTPNVPQQMAELNQGSKDPAFDQHYLQQTQTVNTVLKILQAQQEQIAKLGGGTTAPAISPQLAAALAIAKGI